MSYEQGDAVVISVAEWLSDLSERARAQGHTQRADHLLLLAWQAYDGQQVSLDAIRDDLVGHDHGGSDPGLRSELYRAGT